MEYRKEKVLIVTCTSDDEDVGILSPT